MSSVPLWFIPFSGYGFIEISLATSFGSQPPLPASRCPMKTPAAIKSALAASSVRFSLVHPPAGSAYVSLYLAAGEASPGAFASVNAGNSNAFFVGGGGLNAAFAQAVQNPGAYLNLQTTLYNSAGASGLAYASHPASSGAPVSFAMVQKPAPGQAFHFYEGTVFIDIFQPGTAPGGNPANYAMIYVCPPNGANYASAAKFLAAVQATALNLIGAVRTYNQRLVPQLGGLSRLAVMRLFLFSSGIYRPAQASVGQVAQAVCSGLLDGLASGPTGLTAIQLPNGSGEYSSVAPAPEAGQTPPAPPAP